ncbi:hypothetical protein BT69DRAFT_1280095 [Atractiella rhizophila]|nr:hypothetical protein BT69DRAFT_1280095 [Atractiella rhizophila]
MSDLITFLPGAYYDRQSRARTTLILLYNAQPLVVASDAVWAKSAQAQGSSSS